ncbi:GNAT family N-acetyltransferase [Vibrio viridaestus]|uniref:GNAT family N-acetyltransferase n=1 Tax=Vibrio viridaestus TaxID=2487322 RepID=A0A3N9TEV4_9VIBR|nr:GNAT family N-acetyltransferase [Vibrio viridaestus]RQW62253.1 GNAT family N-acetyltransferase [Vibrio viridaestus]
MKILNVHDFMVSEHHRGKGSGKILLNGIEQYCNANEYSKITLEVNDNNTVAKKLYQSCGFQDYQVEQKDLNHWQKYLV